MLQIPVRIVLTAYGFLQFAAQVLWLGKLQMPRLVRQHAKNGRPQALHAAHRHVIRYIATLRRLDLVHVETVGTPHPAPCVVVANHPSLLDFIVFLRDFPNAVCMYKSRSLKNPVLASFIQVAGYIEGMDGTTSASRRIIDTSCERLMEGHHVVIFPEGTRSASADKMRKFNTTAFYAAIRSGVPIQPVAIYCEPLFLGKGQNWLAFCRSRNTMYIRYLPPIQLTDLAKEKRNAAGFAAAARSSIQHSLECNA